MSGDGAEVERIAIGEGPDARSVAVRHRAGGSPGLFWLGGFMSDMAGSKAEAVDAFADRRGLAMTRFDYSGHGISGGDFAEGTISRWLAEAESVFAATIGPQIVIGSSMGGWIALLLADRAHRRGDSRVAGLILLAPAVDMTDSLMWARMPKAVRAQIKAEGSIRAPSAYDPEGYLITHRLIEDGRQHLFGDRLIEPGCPVQILQGQEDKDVPPDHALALVTRLAGDDVALTLIKDGDHRLSRPEDLARLTLAIEMMIGHV